MAGEQTRATQCFAFIDLLSSWKLFPRFVSKTRFSLLESNLNFLIQDEEEKLISVKWIFKIFFNII